jgi:hypothetical protein
MALNRSPENKRREYCKPSEIMRYINVLLLLAMPALQVQAWELPDFMTEYAEQHASPVSKKEALPLEDTLPQQNSMPGLRVLQDKTESPTESPAPSPSPSWNPTYAPTGSPKPTPDPTEAPTESPAPSPSPSWNPTYGPTEKPSVSPTLEPTELPSHAPSSGPTKTPEPTVFPSEIPTTLPSSEPSSGPSYVPTQSLAPSSEPSASPSSEPSQMPTLSSPPSASPSAVPSISPEPSAMPSQIEMVSYSFVTVLPLKFELEQIQVASFEKSTAAWLESFGLPTVKLTEVDVILTSQTILETKIPTRRHRDLQVTPPALTRLDLQLKYDVSATYTGTDSTLDLHDALDREFQEKNTLWLRELSKEDEIFSSLNPVIVGLEEIKQQQQGSGAGAGSGNGTLVLVLVVAVAATALGLAASVYSVHSHRTTVYGEELASPASVRNSREFAMDVPQSTNSYDTGVLDSSRNSKALALHGEAFPCQTAAMQMLSPNSLEKGVCNPVEPIMESFMYRPEIKQSTKGRNNLDPPSATSAVGIGSKRIEPQWTGRKREVTAYTAHAPPPLSTADNSRDNYRKTAIFDSVSSRKSFSLFSNPH